jgi:hypothetical protein
VTVCYDGSLFNAIEQLDVRFADDVQRMRSDCDRARRAALADRLNRLAGGEILPRRLEVATGFLEGAAAAEGGKLAKMLRRLGKGPGDRQPILEEPAELGSCALGCVGARDRRSPAPCGIEDVEAAVRCADWPDLIERAQARAVEALHVVARSGLRDGAGLRAAHAAARKGARPSGAAGDLAQLSCGGCWSSPRLLVALWGASFRA